MIRIRHYFLFILVAAFTFALLTACDVIPPGNGYKLLTPRTLFGGFLPTELHRDGKLLWPFVTRNRISTQPSPAYMHGHLLVFTGGMPRGDDLGSEQLFVVRDSEVPVVLSERIMGLPLASRQARSYDDDTFTPHFELQDFEASGGGFTVKFNGFDGPNHEFTKSADLTWDQIKTMLDDADTSSRLITGAADYRILPLQPGVQLATDYVAPPGAPLPPYLLAAPPGEALDPTSMTAALVRWVKRTKQQTIRVVETTPVVDLDGGPRQLIVLTTSKNIPAITSPNIRAALARHNAEWKTLQTALREAWRKKDTAAEERLEEQRKKQDDLWENYFPEQLGLYTYRLSLNRVAEPVEYSYPGEPGEMRREDFGREAAIKRLGSPVKLLGYVYYENDTTLMCFQNAAGKLLYTEGGGREYNSKEELRTLYAGFGKIDPRADPKSSIDEKWKEFLAP